ncbi:unnamed protein product [Aspergillus oryzae]|uniref:Unnamed protein product n=1 Tax=Aspergillus oryzae TaxID=5062 RepID=A0AAN4YLN2_ASPOZ|nr:unnamed protein product [Aspergillus oryzae]
MTLAGSCMCGAIAYTSDCIDKRYLVTSAPFTSHICGAFVSCSITGLRIAAGEPSFYDVTGASGKNNRHFFCGKCGSSLFTELEPMADKTVIKAGTLDGGEANLRNKVDVEFYTKDRVSYLCAVQGAKQETLLG